MSNLEIANEIVRQLGGNRFTTMTGATAFVAVEGGVTFLLPRIPGRNGRRVTIRLEATDTYSMIVRRVDGRSLVIPVRDCTGIYVDQLRETFEALTGLRTSL